MALQWREEPEELMTDERKLRQQAARGERAKAILEDDLTVDAFRAIEAQIFQQWMATKPHEEDVRERLYRLHLAHEDYKGLLKTALHNGEVAKRDLIGNTSKIRRMISG